MQESSHITSWVGAMELSQPRFWRPKGLFTQLCGGGKCRDDCLSKALGMNSRNSERGIGQKTTVGVIFLGGSFLDLRKGFIIDVCIYGLEFYSLEKSKRTTNNHLGRLK